MQTIYSYLGTDVDALRTGYSDVIQREFYDGELTAEPRDQVKLTAQKSLSHPISLLRMVSNTGISFRRGWEHIRQNKTGLRVIWFVKHGSVQIVRSRNTCVLGAGECAIIDSSVPFHAKALASDGKFELVYALVPAHLFISHLSVASQLDHPLTLDYAGRESVVRLLDLMADLGDELSQNTAEPLAAAFLEALADRIRDVVDWNPVRKRNTVLRIAEIKAHIMRNLTDPNLNYENVAASCGISPRYLYYLLKEDNTTFAKLVWSQRLEKAKQWLASSELRSHPIREIAFMAGFKDAAHFSRIFKANFAVSPKQYRAQAEARAEEARLAGETRGMLPEDERLIN